MKAGWTTAPIKVLFELKYGKGLPKEKRKPSGKVNVYGSNGVIGIRDTSLTKGYTIIIGRKGSVGEVNISTEKCWPIDTTYYIDEFVGGLPPKYWAFYLRSLRLGQHDKSSAIPGVSRDDIYKLLAPVPPAPEQQRIVAKLEKLMAKVGQCKARMEKIPMILKRFRQSVLAAACSGELTKGWRGKNKETVFASEIVESIRSGRIALANTSVQKEKVKKIYSYTENEDSKILPETWCYVALEKLCDSFQYGTSRKSEPTGKVAVLRMGNIQNGRIDFNDLVYTSDLKEIDKYVLLPQTVLFNRTNSPELVGKTGIFRGEQPAIFAGYLIRINALPEVDPEYINYCLNSNFAKDFCSKAKTDGVSQSNINAQKLGKFEIPFSMGKNKKKSSAESKPSSKLQNR